MNESEIRPEAAVQVAMQLFREDVAAILARADAFVTVPCPACAGAAASPAFEKGGFRFVRCQVCATVYVNPRPDQELVLEYFRTSKASHYWMEHVLEATEPVRRARIFAPRADRLLELCRRHGAPTELLVDIGAGIGTFCLEMVSRHVFRDVVAVEPEPTLVRRCEERGIRVLAEPIEAVALRDVSVLAAFELIEHLFSPSGFLQACHRALAPDGLFILTTPNMAGFDLLVLQQHSDNVDAPTHLNYFHTGSLQRLLEANGFDVLETLTPGLLDAELVRHKVLDGVVSLAGQPFLQRVLIDEWDRLGPPFQTFLADNGLSSHLWMVARRRPGEPA